MLVDDALKEALGSQFSIIESTSRHVVVATNYDSPIFLVDCEFVVVILNADLVTLWRYSMILRWR